MHNPARALQQMSGWQRRMTALLAGLVSVLAMAPFFAWPLLFITFPVLIWLIDSTRAKQGKAEFTAQQGCETTAQQGEVEFTAQQGSWRHSAIIRAAGVGWWFGFGYFAGGLFWIGEAFLVDAGKFAWLLPFAVTLMPAGLALFWAAAAALASAIGWREGRPRDFSRVVALAVCLSGFEWLRGHVLSGFPWNLPGYALTYPLPLMQSAGIFGVYGLTLLALLIFVAPAVIWFDAASLSTPSPQRQPQDRHRTGRAGRAAFAAVAVALLPILMMAAYGWVRLSMPVPQPVAGISLRIVQPNIDQREKWLPQFQSTIFSKHLKLSRRNADGQKDELKHTKLLIWPEAAMPFLPLRQPLALREIARLLPPGSHLLSGALRRQSLHAPANRPGLVRSGKTRLFNSILVFDSKARLVGQYDKTHLVPFGEYLPMQDWLEAIGLRQLDQFQGGFSSGAEPRPLLQISGLPPIGPLICYEAIFPGVVALSKGRPAVLINVTNDGWFGNTTGPRQHFQQARVRAVEEGLPLIRAANNGISAVIDPMGRILHRLGMNEAGVIDSVLPAAIAAPPYSRGGDDLFWVMWLICIIVILRNHRRSRL